MTLNSVVLPAPLGPMRPVTYPTSTSSETSESAWMPPKRTETSRMSSSATSGSRSRCGRARDRLVGRSRRGSLRGRTAALLRAPLRFLRPLAFSHVVADLRYDTFGLASDADPQEARADVLLDREDVLLDHRDDPRELVAQEHD